jgi:membrane associated rhomboid family serine protease
MVPLLPITRALILANVGIFIVQWLSHGSNVGWFALWPWGSSLFRYWQLVTYAFLHDPNNFAHIFFNMFALYMFGSEVERVLGMRRYLVYYFVCVIGAAVLQMWVTRLMGGVVGPIVGASGGVFGLLLAFGMFFPQRRIMLLLPPIPIRAWLFVTLYGLIELGMGVFGTQQGVAHFAHLGGMLAGFIMLSVWRNRQRYPSGPDDTNGW